MPRLKDQPPDAASAKNASSSTTVAEQEAGSSTTVFTTPGRQHFHPGHPKAWFTADASSGTPTIGADYGISSLGDDGVGRIQVNLDTAFSSTNYAAIATARSVTATAAQCANPDTTANDPKTTSAYDFRVRRSATDTAQDSAEINMEFYGDL